MVRIKEVAGDTKVTYPSPLVRRRRPKVVGPVESGFVLILVLPVAMLLLMTALSLVTRSNSAAIASVNESRAQAARMAAEFGLNQFMALVNTQYNPSLNPPLVVAPNQPIANSPGASYTILFFNLPVNPVGSCSEFNTNNADLYVTIEGKSTVGSTDYKRMITRALSVCALGTDKLRVRDIK
jgi:hypothetical protein